MVFAAALTAVLQGASPAMAGMAIKYAVNISSSLAWLVRGFTQAGMQGLSSPGGRG